MESYEALTATLALTMGAAWASGINLYAALLVLGIGGSTGNIDLPPDLQVLQDPMVIGAAGLMYFVEFFVDKTPGVDTGWDTLHTFVRIPAGAMLAAGAVGDVTPVLEVAAGILGGGMAATSHVAKASSRMLINTSPEPFSNWGASISEDLMVLGGLWAALYHPVLFLVLLVLFILLVIWLLPRIWRLLKVVINKIRVFFGGEDKLPEETENAQLAAADAEGDSLSKLERLQKLRESGALTEEEFSAQKQQLLG